MEETTFNWYSVLFGAFGIAGVQIIWEAIKYFVARYDKNAKRDPKNFTKKQEQIADLFSQLLHEGVEIQESLEDLAEYTGAARVCIYKLQNGGGVPQLGTVQTISILNESIRYDLIDQIDPIRKEIQNFIVDGSYQKTLSKILNGDVFVSDVTNLESGQIKTLHEGLQNKKVCIFLITHIPELDNDKSKGFMIFSVMEFNEDVNIDAGITTQIEWKKEKIRNIFNNFYIKQYKLLN